jgi:hypothetical protein
LGTDESFVQEASEGLAPLARLPDPPAVGTGTRWSAWHAVILGDLELERLVVSAGLQGLDAPARLAEELQRYVESGGVLIRLVGGRHPAIMQDPLDRLGGVTIGERVEAHERLVAADSEEGRAWARSVKLPEGGVELHGRFAVTGLHPAAETLLRTEEGHPLVVARRRGRGCVLTVLFEDSWRWRAAPGSPEFVEAFWGRMLRDALARRDDRKR